jgi:hypothetical protein
MARPEFEPTEEARSQVRQLSGRGVPHKDIAHLVGISIPTLHKHFRDDLDIGMAEANATVSGRLFAMTETNVAAAIFWSKARLGWSEKHQVEVSGPDGGPVATTVDAAGALGALMAQLAASKAEGGDER